MTSSAQSSRPNDNLKRSGPPPGFAPRPISFAQALASASVGTKKEPSSSHQPTQPPPETVIGELPQKPRLRRIPPGKDRNVLNSYLELELKDPGHRALFIEVFRDDAADKKLILVRGVPGSGKSVLAALLASVTTQGEIFSADDHFVDRRGVYRFNPQEIGRAHERCQEGTKRSMIKSKSPLIVDNTNTMTWEMIPYAKMAIEYGYRVLIVEPNTSWKWNARMLAQKNTHGVALDKIKGMIARFEKGITPDKLTRQVQSEQLSQQPQQSRKPSTHDLESSLKSLKLT